MQTFTCEYFHIRRMQFFSGLLGPWPLFEVRMFLRPSHIASKVHGSAAFALARSLHSIGCASLALTAWDLRFQSSDLLRCGAGSQCIAEKVEARQAAKPYSQHVRPCRSSECPKIISHSALCMRAFRASLTAAPAASRFCRGRHTTTQHSSMITLPSIFCNTASNHTRRVGMLLRQISNARQ